MAKYKLIKKLPFEGSPEIGYISEEKMVGSGIHYWNANWFDPANYPEFWELVVEKDYEILNLNIDNSLVTCNNHGGWGNRKNIQECTLEWLLKEYPNSIHSVKRKDGKIFSVGDKLYFRDGEVRKITGISLDDTGVSEFSKRSIPWLECGKDYGTCLDWAVHYKKPILITEDGVEIFEGDIYWRLIAVLKNQRIFEYLEKVDEKGEFPYRGGGGLFFSTRELAEKYIEENKLLYNKKDILDFAEKLFKNLYSSLTLEQLFDIWKKEKGE